MSGNRALFDSNIIIYASQGKLELQTFLQTYDFWSISIITYMEVLGFPFSNTAEEILISDILKSFDILGISQPIADQVVELRKRYKIKLPDAIIWSTAKTNNLTLITCNSKDFEKLDPAITLVIPSLSP